MDNKSKSDVILALTHISKQFGKLEILKRVDLQLKKSESIAIVGPSGIGKSTLLHIAGVMERPTKGEVEIGGEKTSSLSEALTSRLRLDKIGFLFQFHYLLPDFDVLENVLIPCRLAQDDMARAEEEARMLLKRLGLVPRLHHKPNQLSGGEQQRTALARALIRKPSLLLCDEPTGNLDLETAKTVLSLLWDEVKQFQLSVLIVTHSPLISAQADHVLYLEGGVLKKKLEVLS